VNRLRLKDSLTADIGSAGGRVGFPESVTVPMARAETIKRLIYIEGTSCFQKKSLQVAPNTCLPGRVLIAGDPTIQHRNAGEVRSSPAKEQPPIVLRCRS